MYSGITKGLFPVTKVDKGIGLISYEVSLSQDLTADLSIGASVAIDGVCQTVVAINSNSISLQAIDETLRKTTLDKLYVGRLVSVERSLRYGDEVGGHEVAGHVYGKGIVSQVLKTGGNLTLVIHCAPAWMKYILPKGFVAVDGSSLTVGETDPGQGLFTLHLIPETQRVTNFKYRKINDEVNIELDHKTKTIVDTVESVVKKMNLTHVSQ